MLQYKKPNPGSGFMGFRVFGVYAKIEREAEFSTAASGSQDESNAHFRYQKIKAQMQEAEWESEEALYQYKISVSQDDPHAGKHQGVGCHGIFCGFFHTKTGGWQAGFRVRSGRGIGTRFVFSKTTFSSAWRQSVLLWASIQGVEDEDVLRLLRTPPEPSQFKELRRRMNENEHAEIPIDTLNPVFAEQREKFAKKKELDKARKMKLSRPDTRTTEDLEVDMMSWFESKKG